MKRKNSPAFAEPKQALESYLDALLRDMPAIDEEEVDDQAKPELAEEELQEPEIAPEVVAPEPIVAKSEPAPEPAWPESADEAPVEELSVPELTPLAGSEGGDAPPDEVGRPAWAKDRFECLLFNVSGLKLAVPLIELGGVLTFPEKGLTPLFGQAKWFMGLLPAHSGQMVRVVDTALWVMPDRYDEAQRASMRYVIMMEGSDWGLGCHEVAEAITLSVDDVRWRTERSKRPWLAGTVIEHMCAIMDVGAMNKLLNAGDKNYRPQEDK
ncbi:chemotaxis protein CheW [Pokkaliibacter sp. CJK22405]|uniref:chemotaxis protein CheW n=1 Tax=Pokkaliibacter sp. CJK22405 TaxID=3384615 RepID=UPI003984AAFA